LVDATNVRQFGPMSVSPAKLMKNVFMFILEYIALFSSKLKVINDFINKQNTMLLVKFMQGTRRADEAIILTAVDKLVLLMQS
jgi:hypothetical protein